MTYTPINWQTGDTITAAKLNKMDRGWNAETTVFFDGTLTTVDDGTETSYSNWASFEPDSPIVADSITVTIGGQTYECRNHASGYYEYGATWDDSIGGYDYSEYPFFIGVYDNLGTRLYTETAGTYTLRIETSSYVVSADFSAAVTLGVVPSVMLCVSGETTFDDMVAAYEDGRLLIFHTANVTYATYIITGFSNNSNCIFIPSSSSINASFDANGLFIVSLV